MSRTATSNARFDSHYSHLQAVASRKEKYWSPHNVAEAARLFVDYEEDPVFQDIRKRCSRDRSKPKARTNTKDAAKSLRAEGAPPATLARHACKIYEMRLSSVERTGYRVKSIELLFDASHGHITDLLEIGRVLSHADFRTNAEVQSLLARPKNEGVHTLKLALRDIAGYPVVPQGEIDTWHVCIFNVYGTH